LLYAPEKLTVPISAWTHCTKVSETTKSTIRLYIWPDHRFITYDQISQF